MVDIKKIRTMLGYSQQGFAKKLNLNNAYLCRLEKGKLNLTERLKDSLILKFNVNKDYLDGKSDKIFIDKNYEEILFIFQGANVFYNLKKLLLTKKEILVDNCNSSIIFSLIKSDTIFASALFNIKFGEYWIKFNFENKKKLNKFTIYDFIKIKISLSELNLSKQLSKAIFQNKLSKYEYNTSTYNTNNSHLNGKKSILLTSFI